LENSDLPIDPDPIYVEPESFYDDIEEELEFGKAIRRPQADHNVRQQVIEVAEEAEVVEKHTGQQWLLSLISAALVGLSGIFPLLVIPIETGKSLHHGAGAARLQLLLSFAVGGLLGDVFLHLLPEAWAHLNREDHDGHMWVGLWIIAGLLSFLMVEKVFPDDDDEEDDEDDDEEEEEKVTELDYNTEDLKTTECDVIKNGHVKNGHVTNGHAHHRMNGVSKKLENGLNGVNGHVTNGHVANGHVANGHVANGHVANGHVTNGHVANGHIANGHIKNGKKGSKDSKHKERQAKSEHIKTTGWLNLTANIVDNFTHGLAVAGSYCVSTKVGLLTTLTVLLHEVPHEIGDFAILLRSGFDRWQAAKAQLITATGGLVGAFCALMADSAQAAGDRTAWILPFTSGGFIYIALVTVVPDLLKETNPRESIKQFVLLCAGILVMMLITLLC
jgi:zinc transporter 13